MTDHFVRSFSVQGIGDPRAKGLFHFTGIVDITAKIKLRLDDGADDLSFVLQKRIFQF